MRHPRILLAIGIALFVSRAGAATAPPFKYAHRAWQVADGLPGKTVYSMVQDRAGYIWVATWDGFARFDGTRFTTFNRKNVPGLETDHSWQIHLARDGTIWVVNGGLVRIRDGVMRVWPEKAFPAPVDVLAETPDGSLWLTTDRGLVRFRDGITRVYTKADGMIGDVVTWVSVDRAGGLWLIGPAGLMHFDGRSFRNIALPGSLHDAKRIFVGRDDSVWLLFADVLVRLQGGQFTVFDERITAIGLQVLHEDSKGVLRLGLAYGKGIFRFDGTSFVRDDPATDPLTDKFVTAFLEDREGALWVGTYYGGLNQLRSSPVTVYRESDGLPGPATLSVLADRAGGVWIGSNGNGLAHYSNGRFRSYTAADGLPDGYIRTLHEDREGTLWIGTSRGVGRFVNGRFSVVATHDGRLKNQIRDIESDGSTVWIGTEQGLIVLEGTRTHQYTVDDGLPVPVTRLARSGDRLWIGTYEGLHVLRGGRISKSPIDGSVTALVQSATGNLWVGVEDRGLWRIRNGRITRYTSRDGLLNDTIHDMLETPDGDLWLTSSRGVFRVRVHDLDELDRNGTKFRYEALEAADGVPEPSVGAPAIARDTGGRLWIPTIRGVAVLDPAALGHRSRERVSVALESAIADGTVLPAHAVDLAPGTRQLTFQYTGLHFDAPESFRFRYRLVGLDDAWVDAGNQRQAYFTRLPPGRYRFEVEAHVKDGPWLGRVASPSVTILPFFWQRSSFRFACGALVLVFPFAFYRIRMLRSKRREETLKGMVRERTVQLAASSRRNQLVLDAAGEGIFGLDADGRTMFINPAGAEMLGWTADELLGRELHPLVHAAGDGQVCPICATPQQREKTNTYGTLLSRNGTAVAVDFTVGAETDPFVVTFRDATARLALERAKDEFVATVSHELKTPLTAIRGSLGLLESGSVPIQSAPRLVRMAIANSDRLLRLVNDILDSERLSSGTVELQYTRFIASAAIQQASEVMMSLADRAGVRIEAAPLDLEMEADFDRILQVLTNLISNAVKFSPPQSVVRIGAESDGLNIVFGVSDEGRGIPAEKLDTVFERFRQVEAGDATKKGGSGLGLAICRGIAEAHGGMISVTSTPGRGSTFSVTLPLGAATPLAAGDRLSSEESLLAR